MSTDPGIETKTAGKPSPSTNRWLADQNGDFTKTGGMLVIAGFVVLLVYFVQAMFHGLVVPIGQQLWTIPVFDIVAAGGLLGIFATLYVTNKAVQNKAVNDAAKIEASAP